MEERRRRGMEGGREEVRGGDKGNEGRERERARLGVIVACCANPASAKWEFASLSFFLHFPSSVRIRPAALSPPPPPLPTNHSPLLSPPGNTHPTAWGDYCRPSISDSPTFKLYLFLMKFWTVGRGGEGDDVGGRGRREEEIGRREEGGRRGGGRKIGGIARGNKETNERKN